MLEQCQRLVFRDNRGHVQKIGLKKRHCPGKNLNIELPIDWVSRYEGKMPLDVLELSVEKVHGGGKSQVVHVFFGCFAPTWRRVQ